MYHRHVGLLVATISVFAVACGASGPAPAGSPGAAGSLIGAPGITPGESAGPNRSFAASPPGSTGPAASPTRAATPGPWHSAPASTDIAGVQFWHVVWSGQRFVATGSALGGSGAFVDSTDGALWHRQPLAGADAFPDVLAAGPAGVVAVGRIGETPASWFSRDGTTWTVRASAFPRTIGGDDVSVSAIIATDNGWLAVGRADPPCNTDCGLAPVRALAWTSADGLRWTRVADQSSFAKAGMTGVARVGDGFVAVGLAGDHAAVWTSADGATWTRVRDSPLFHALPNTDPSAWAGMRDVAATDGVVVAIGDDGPGGTHGPAGRAWRSVDGASWDGAQGEGFAAAGELSVLPTDVVATPAGFLAVAGSHGSCASGIWTTTDGASWRCEAADPLISSMTAYAAAASGSVEVVVGLDSSGEPGGDGFPGAVWLRSIP